MRRISLIFLFILFTSGCTTLTESTGKDIEEPGTVILLGTTTKADIIRIFGEPSKATAEGGTEEFVYEFKKTETPTYMGGLVVGEAGKVTTIKTLKIVIQDGMVKSYKFEAKNE